MHDSIPPDPGSGPDRFEGAGGRPADFDDPEDAADLSDGGDLPSPGSGAESRSPEPGRRRLGRPRFVEAEAVREPGSRARVRVVLELGGREHASETRGVGEEVMVLRLVAEASLAALEQAIDRPAFFELVGVKRIHAFDETVVLTCVRSADEPGRRLLGCVPVGRRTLAEAAALSLLNATNRVVEWLPAREGGGAA